MKHETHNSKVIELRNEKAVQDVGNQGQQKNQRLLDFHCQLQSMQTKSDKAILARLSRL